MRERLVDVLVVGAGPAGSTAARIAAERGLSVVLVERRPRVGAPVRCGEYVPRGLVGEVPAGALTSRRRAPSLALHLPSGETRDVAAPGEMIDRGDFDRALADAAVGAGAELLLSTPLVDLDRRGRVWLGGAGERLALRAATIVGADGPRSRVARAAGLGRPRVMLGLQRDAALARPVRRAHLYFWRECRHGYGWVFPTGAGANLGVAVPQGAGRVARAALATLTARAVADGLLAREELARAHLGEPGRSGLVPCSGPLPRLGAGRVLLAGDAAGQTDALTGAGIVAAVRAGEMAGRAVADATEEGKPRRAAPAYEARWRAALGRQASRALARRFDLEARWDRDTDRAVRAAWLGGDEEDVDGRKETTRHRPT